MPQEIPQDPETYDLKTSCTPDLLYTFGVSLQASHRLTLHARPTPDNLAYRDALQTFAEQLPQRQPFSPADLDLLRRSLTSTQALREMGIPLEHPLHRDDLAYALAMVARWARQCSRSQLVA